MKRVCSSSSESAPDDEVEATARTPTRPGAGAPGGAPRVALTYSITTRSVPDRPNVSGWYISSAFAGGTT